MKAMATAAKKRQPAASRAAPAHAPHAVRRSPDRHERQADQRSAQFVAGDLGLGAGLHAAPAAGACLPASVPDRLPNTLRASLEQAFSADLSTLRIHRDEPARAAARALQANAFASGASIYFAAGSYDPHSIGGRALIAHEVTHVLQQAGRASAGGRMRVDDVHGAGAVQCQWTSPLESSEVQGTAADFLSGHADALDTGVPERAVIERLMRESEAPGTGGAVYWSVRAAHVMAGSSDPALGGSPSTVSPLIASAVYDGLKISGLTVAAAKLLHTRHDLQTLFFSAPTYARYVDDHGSDFNTVKQRLYELWYGGGWFGNATPRFMLDRSLIVLLGPSAANSWQSVPGGDMVDTANAELLNRHSATLGPDELYYVTVLVASQIEQLRHAMFESVQSEVTGMNGYDPNDRVGVKRTMAARLKLHCDQLIASRSTTLAGIADGSITMPYARETLILWLEDVVPALRDMAIYATDFWNTYELFDTSLRSGDNLAGLTETAAAQLAEIDTVLPEYRLKLNEFFHSVLDRLADGTLPEPQAFAQRRDDAVQLLAREMFRIVERPLADRLMAALPSGSASSRAFSFSAAAADRALPLASRGLYAWALTIANIFRRQAKSTYSSSADTALITRQRGVAATAPATDLRDLFRIRLAETAFEIAARAGWDNWVEWMRPITYGVEADDEGNELGSDYVAFGTDWQLDAEVPVTRMRDDLPNVAVGFEPLRTNDLVEFYLAKEYDTLTGHIDTLLGTNQGVYTLESDPVLNQAFEAARAEFRPQRYVIRDWEWVTPWVDEGDGGRRRAPRLDLRVLLGEHPLTRALVRDVGSAHNEPSAWAVNGAPVDGKFTAVLWIMPSPLELIVRLQAAPDVSQVVLAALPELVAELPNLLSDTGPMTVEERRQLSELVAGIEAGQTVGPDSEPMATTAQPLQNLTLEMLMALPWQVWWDLWRAILSVHAGDRRAELLADLRLAIQDAGLSEDLRYERETAFDTALAAQRRAIAHERRRIVETQLRPALTNFEPRSFTRYRIPGSGRASISRLLAQDTAGLLDRFVNQLPELTEREGHLAMAVLELADPIHDKLAEHRDLDDIAAWVPMIDTALYWAGLAEGGADTAMRDSFTVAEEQGDTGLFDARRAKLQEVLDHMAVVLRERFMEWGVVGVPGDGTIENPGSAHALGREARSVSRGTAFTIDGRTWEILQVVTGFTFHPGSFALRSMRNREIAGSMLKIGSGDYLAEGERPNTLLMRVMIDEGPEPTEIYADGDTEILTQLTWALHMHATLEQLGDLAAAMQTFGELMIDAAELFPGGGQAVAATRLLTTAMSVIDGELPDMIEHLVTNPRALLDAVWSRLDDLLTVENAIGFLLFSNTSFNGLIREPRSAGPRSLGGSTSRRMRRLLFKLQSFGRSMGRIFVRVHDGVQDRRQQVEHAVQNSPRMVRLIQIVADYYLIVATLADHLPDITDLPGAVTEFQAGAQNLPQRIDEMIASLGSVELPADILPRAELVDVLLDVIGNRLGGKYKLGVRVLLQLLDFIGARDDVVNAIAEVLRRAGLTTENLFPAWNDTIVPGIRDYLQAAQTAMRDTLNETFDAFGAPLGLAAPQADVRTSGSEFPEAGPEAQPLLNDDLRAGLQSRTGGAALNPGHAGELLGHIGAESGEALPAAARTDAEARFGQDFSHVRMHRDRRAGELARSLGAQALTSGSHVVLGDGARDLAGARPVLYHELAHVVQQTGARPRGSRPAAPRSGRAGRGLRWDPRAEAEAESAAATAERGRASGLRPGGSAAAGWQPDMIELYGQRFLRQLTDVTAIEAEVAAIDASGTSTGARLIGRDVRRAVAHVGDNLRTKFRPGTSGLRAAVGGPFHGKLDLISTHLLGAHAQIAAGIEDIAIRASHEAERARQGRPARMALSVHDFSRRLERYIFGKTGILLELDAETRGVGQDAVFQNPNQPYRHADVKFVFLAHVHGNSQLWKDALTHRTTATGLAEGIDLADRAAVRTQIRPVLRDLGPSSSIWASNAYRFSHAVFAAAEELGRLQQTAASAGTLPAASLPSREHYLDTTGSDATPGFGNQRLHLGTFDQKATGEQSGKERESHHLTQYLLVEYFHNGATGSPETDQDRMGFPLLRSHADAYGSDMHVNSVDAPLRFRDVQIDELEQGRGGKMPTILLARGTHRRGNLHINPRADDFSDAPVGTQAGAVNHIYKNALQPEAQRRVEHEVAEGTQPYSAWEDYRRLHDISTPIYNAMQQTYRYMRTFMQTQLRSGLAGIERGYYNDLHAAAHPTSDAEPMTADDMAHVADKAVAHNNDGDAARGIRGLQSYGWRG